MTDQFEDGYTPKDRRDLTHSNISKKPVRQTAVALKDGTLEGKLPEITASGRGKIAEKILELAFANDIKVREDSALAEMLAAMDIDSPIPSEAFMAVAEILSYVYKANGQPNPFDIYRERVKGNP